MKKLLKRLLAVPTHTGECQEMQAFLLHHIKMHGYPFAQDSLGNIYVQKGSADSYPTYVAHIDTVHEIEKGGIVPIELNGAVTGINPLTMRQTGIGGDDKCGIYAALRCLRVLPACKVVLFVDEESGCVGSRACDITFFKDARFVLQADRRGHADWVDDISGPLGSVEFQKAVAPILERHGFKPHDGAFTDVMTLRNRDVGVSVANMSAGYYEPHTRAEFIYLPHLENTIEMMLAMGKELAQPFPFVHTPPAVTPIPVGFVNGGGGRHASRSGHYGYGYEYYSQGPKSASKPVSQGQKEMFDDAEMFAEGFADTAVYGMSINNAECAACRNVHPIINLEPIGAGNYLCQDCIEHYGLSVTEHP